MAGTVTLSPAQQAVGRQLLQAALANGAPAARAPELIDAAYSESSLNPAARNNSSGAAGLFQLLSSGYVNRANQLGGVNNPTANLKAILPDYLRYWQQNPQAAPGAAAAAVERSGQGASFYSNGVGRQVAGGAQSPLARAAAGVPAPSGLSAQDLAILNQGAKLAGLPQLPGLLAGPSSSPLAMAAAPKTANLFSSTGRYVSPLDKVTSIQRVDQGQDLTGVPGEPVRAIGAAHVDAVKPDPGGFGYAEYYTLTDGPLAGEQFYVGHAQPDVKAGQTVAAGAPIATLLQHPYGTSTPGWVEIGQAKNGVPAASSFNGETPTPQGQAFAQLLRQISGGRA